MITVYRTHIDRIPGDLFVPDTWSVELLTHTEDGKQVEFVGEYFSRDDAEAIAAAWRNEATRKIVWMAAALQQPQWHHNQGE